MPRLYEPMNHNPSVQKAPAMVPPRHWWLKRTLLACGCLLGLLGVLRVWWGFVAQSRLQHTLARYREAGEPIEVADLAALGDAADAKSAGLLQKAAEALILSPDQAQSLYNLRNDLSAAAGRLEELRLLLETNRAALEGARASRLQAAAGWDSSLTQPGPNFSFDLVQSQVLLNNLICLAAAYEHYSGNDAEAVEYMHDHCSQAAAIAKTPYLLSEAMPSGPRPYGLGPLEALTPKLRVASGVRAGPDEVKAAERSRMMALIAALLDEEGLRLGLERLMHRQRAEELEAILAHSRGMERALVRGVQTQRPLSLRKRVMARLLRPMYELDAVHLFLYCANTAEAGAASNWSEYLRHRPPDPIAYQGALTQLARPMSQMTAPSFGKAVRATFRAIASRRMAATGLAIRLYEIDHGRRPGALHELVPDYLPETPLDPFGNATRVMGYRGGVILPTQERPTTVLYSIGPDGRDDGGEYVDPRGGGSGGADRGDILFFLDGNRPSRRALRLAAASQATSMPVTQPASQPATQPASTQAGEDQQNKEDRQGNQPTSQQGGGRP